MHIFFYKILNTRGEDMMDCSNYGFREPLSIDPNSRLYITCAQMQFFLNRPDGYNKFVSASKEFMEYYSECNLYNYFYDKALKDKSIDLYWNHKTESLSFSYLEGEIDKELFELGLTDEEGHDYLI